MEKIRIFDTTLRDGEQSPGCSMNLSEKIEIGKNLERLGVDVIEAGFAISSPGDFKCVETIAKEIKNASVASLARAIKKDIEVAYEAVKHSVSPVIHTFIATSPIHMEYKLKMSEDEVLETTKEMVKYAHSLCSNVEFSCEDASRSNLEFLKKVVEVAIENGAKTINLPDTVGYAMPREIKNMVKYIKENVRGIENAVISVHNHNDLGMGVANSLAGIEGGALQVECTINGIGERAGNTALEEIVMALNTRKEYYNVETNINTTHISRASSILYNIIGQVPPLNKPIVGKNAFLHESGIHQHGVLSNKLTYEILTPESIGLKIDNLVLGKHSGHHAFVNKLVSLGYNLNEEELDVAFKKFKILCDKKKEVSDSDIDGIVNHLTREESEGENFYRFKSYKISYDSNSDKDREVSIFVEYKGKILEYAGLGDGPIDAAFDAINNGVDIDYILEDFSIRSLSKGKETLGETVVFVNIEGKKYKGKGLSTDIIESSILAYLNAINASFNAQGAH